MTFALGPYGGALGFSMSLNAASGDLHHAIESGVAPVPRNVIDAILLGGTR